MILENIMNWAIFGVILLLLATVFVVIFVKNKNTLAKFGLFVGAYVLAVSLLVIIVEVIAGRDIFSGILFLLSSTDNSHMGEVSRGTLFGMLFIVGAFILIGSWNLLSKTKEKA